MARAVSHRPLKVKVPVRSKNNTFAIPVEQSGNGTVYLWLLRIPVSASFHQCSTLNHLSLRPYCISNLQHRYIRNIQTSNVYWCSDRENKHRLQGHAVYNNTTINVR